MSDREWTPHERALLERIVALARINGQVADFWLGHRCRLTANAFIASMEALTTSQGESADSIEVARGGILDLATRPRRDWSQHE